MPVVALARALFAIIPKRGAWARGSGCRSFETTSSGGTF
jgi:hypothetical protein